VSFTVYYASDIHGSDRLWRKFVNAGPFYGADVLVMGGDLAGKAVLPIVRQNGGYIARELDGERVPLEAALSRLLLPNRDMRRAAAEGVDSDPLIDLSRIDFDVLAARFAGRKRAEMERLRGAIEGDDPAELKDALAHA